MLDTLKSALYGQDDDAKTVAVEGFSKLMLLKVHRDTEVLQALMLLYYHPSTADILRLRQCLNFFLQVFAYSSHENQDLIRQITVSTIKNLSILYRQNEKEFQFTPLLVAQQFIDWTDSNKVIVSAAAASAEGNPQVKQRNHAKLALEMLKECNDDPSSWAKLFISCLVKMKIGKDATMAELTEISEQSNHLQRVSTYIYIYIYILIWG